jgi:hypothetical protein
MHRHIDLQYLLWLFFLVRWDCESTWYCTSPRWLMIVTGAICGMKIGRGNRSTWEKPLPVSLCPPQKPHDLTRAVEMGNQRVTAQDIWHGPSTYNNTTDRVDEPQKTGWQRCKDSMSNDLTSRTGGRSKFTTSVQTPPNEVPLITGGITCLVIHRHSLLRNRAVRQAGQAPRFVTQTEHVGDNMRNTWNGTHQRGKQTENNIQEKNCVSCLATHSQQ